MKTSSCEVAIIGAGPYGLSATAYLRSAGVETRTFGKPMEFWQNQMPAGMMLRSYWDASHIADPNRALTIDQYQSSCGVRVSRPVPIDDFIRYGLWFQQRVLPDLDTRSVRRLERGPEGFRLCLEDGTVVDARRVVVATGIATFAHRLSEFDGIPPSLASHASDHRNLARFARQQVVVIGGGQSALESAALLSEAGAEVEVIVRNPAIQWLVRSGILHRNALQNLLYHWTDVGPAGVSHLAGRPDWFRRLPRPFQDRLARLAIRPAGSAWLVPRVKDVRITTGQHVVSANSSGSQIRVTLSDGSTRLADHVLMGTGYRVDISRHRFLTSDLLKAISQIRGYPRLAAGFETSVRGLHFVGAPAAWSFGPVMRFVSGTDFTAKALTRAILEKSSGQASSQRVRWATAAKLRSG